MRHFALFINEQVRGPHTEAEIAEMIARGEVSSDTPCAPDGSTEWEPLSNHFSFGSRLRVNRGRQAEETDMPKKDGVDVEQRRKLLIYGLADSVSIDQFDRHQAQALIDAHEAKVRARIARHRWAGIVGIAAGLLIGIYAGLRTEVDRPLTAAAESMLGKDDRVASQLRGLDREVAQFDRLKETVAKVPFAKPTGGAPAAGVLTSRLKLDASRAFRVRGQVNVAPLAEKAGRWKASLDGSLKIVFLPAPMPRAVADKASAQSEVLETVLSPMLDQAKFEELREELLRTFPAAPGNAEAERLRTEIGQLKIAELGAALSRVESRAASASSAPGGAGWAGELRAFAARMRSLHDRVRINVDMQARRRMWSDFNAGAGAELTAWMLASGGKEVTPGADGAFTLDEVPRLGEAEAARRLLIVTRINGDPVHLPWGSPFLILGELRAEPLPTEHFLLGERYKVVAKPVMGGLLYAAKLRVGGKELTVERRSPRWHYLSLAREKDADAIHLLVDERTHGGLAVGDVVPAELILKGEVYVRPSDSAVPPNLTPVP